MIAPSESSSTSATAAGCPPSSNRCPRRRAPCTSFRAISVYPSSGSFGSESTIRMVSTDTVMTRFTKSMM